MNSVLLSHFVVFSLNSSTPAKPPKLRGKSTGWKTGKPRKRRIKYPIVRKTTPKPPKKAKESAYYLLSKFFWLNIFLLSAPESFCST